MAYLTTMIFAAKAMDAFGILVILGSVSLGLYLFKVMPGVRLEESPAEAIRSTIAQRKWVEKFWKVELFSAAAWFGFAILVGFLTYYGGTWALWASSARQAGDLFFARPEDLFVVLVAIFTGFALATPCSMLATCFFLTREDFGEFTNYLNAKAGYMATRALIALGTLFLVGASVSMIAACDCYLRVTPTAIECNDFLGRGTVVRPLSTIRSLVEVQPRHKSNGQLDRTGYSRIDFSDGSSLKLHPNLWGLEPTHQRDLLNILAKETGLTVETEPYHPAVEFLN